jgi:hypothetical protein
MLLLALIYGVSSSNVECTGKSAILSSLECNAWMNFHDSTDGPKWKECAELRTDPCGCNEAAHDASVKCLGGNIVEM